MSTVSSIGFRSLTDSSCGPNECPKPQYVTTNFKGYPADSYESSQKKSHPVLAVGGILAVAALAIAGLGYAHKANWINKLGEGKFKNISETVTGKCHEWCSWTKEHGTKVYDSSKDWCVKQFETIKGWFNKK